MSGGDPVRYSQLQLGDNGLPWAFTAPDGARVYVPRSALSTRKLALKLRADLLPADAIGPLWERALVREALEATFASICLSSLPGVFSPPWEEVSIDHVACAPILALWWKSTRVWIVVRRLPRGDGWPSMPVPAADDTVDLLTTVTPRTATREWVLTGSPVTEPGCTHVLTRGAVLDPAVHCSFVSPRCGRAGTAGPAGADRCSSPGAPRP